jgi:hypothetical protein
MSKDLSDKFILWLCCQKLKPENESQKTFPKQLGKMISSMITYNNVLSVLMLWALAVMEEDSLRDDSDTHYSRIYRWGAT